MTPRSVLKLKVDDMRAAGLSARKVEYWSIWRCISTAAVASMSQWDQMDDEAIVAELVAIRGIGRWTAEMFLIFHLARRMPAAGRRHADSGISQHYSRATR
jgi:DNA-3-methyladenine glycosylase II